MHHSRDGAKRAFHLPRDGAGAVVEHRALGGRAGGPRPAGLVGERGGAMEHMVHELDLPDIPAREVAGKRSGALEHTVHGLDLPDIPAIIPFI